MEISVLSTVFRISFLLGGVVGFPPTCHPFFFKNHLVQWSIYKGVGNKKII